MLVDCCVTFLICYGKLLHSITIRIIFQCVKGKHAGMSVNEKAQCRLSNSRPCDCHVMMYFFAPLICYLQWDEHFMGVFFPKFIIHVPVQCTLHENLKWICVFFWNEHGSEWNLYKMIACTNMCLLLKMPVFHWSTRASLFQIPCDSSVAIIWLYLFVFMPAVSHTLQFMMMRQAFCNITPRRYLCKGYS